MRRLRQRLIAGDDSGTILPLTIAYAVLAITIIFVAVAATSLYLERKRLFTLADGAALAGAEAFDLRSVRLTPEGPRPTLTSDGVSTAVRDYLDDAPTDGFTDLTVRRSESTDGASASVTLAATWRPPVLSGFLPGGVPIEVTSIARSVFQ